jgi:hypothetical protein
VAGRDSSAGDAVKPSKPVRPVRGVIVFLIAVAPVVLLAAAWARTGVRSYYVAVFTPGGAVQGVASHGGSLVVAFSNLSFGRERGLTALTDAVAPAEFEQTYAIVYTDVPEKRERWGFGYAAGHEDDVDEDTPAAANAAGPSGVIASHLAVVVPIWVPLGIAVVPPIRLATRGLRRWKRWRGGRCLACGYDLRHTTGRCPECGTPFTETRGVTT